MRSGACFFEKFWFYGYPIRSGSNPTHVIQSTIAPPDVPIFNSYLEVAVKRGGKSGYTETIENAFVQVMKGHTGMMAKIIGFDQAQVFKFCSIPVVVTTAELVEATFQSEKIGGISGMIEASDLKLQTMPYCAVTYHPNDSLAKKSRFSSDVRGSIEDDVANWQTRTVFVVQSGAILGFLNRLGELASKVLS